MLCYLGEGGGIPLTCVFVWGNSTHMCFGVLGKRKQNMLCYLGEGGDSTHMFFSLCFREAESEHDMLSG